MYIQKTTLCKEAQSILKLTQKKQKTKNKKQKTKNKNKNRGKKLITKKKRAKEQRGRFTRCESPSPRPIQKGPV